MLALIVGIVALVVGLVSEIEGSGRNWAGWGVVALALYLVYTAAT